MTLDPETGREPGSTPVAVGEFDEPHFLSIHPDGRLQYDIQIVEDFRDPLQGSGACSGIGMHHGLRKITDAIQANGRNPM